MSGQVVRGRAATMAIARMTFTRIARGKSLWIALGLGVLVPLMAVSIIGGAYPETMWRRTVSMIILLLPIVPPLLTASAIAEELEDKTFTYLWSRPIPRWSVVTGKLLAAVPVVVVVLLAATVGGFYLVGGPSGDALPRGLIAAFVAAISLSAASIGLGSLFRKQPMATAVAYLLLLDIPVGSIDFSLSNLALTRHFRDMTGVFDSSAELLPAVLWSLGIAAVWLAVAVFRVVLSEPRTTS